MLAAARRAGERHPAVRFALRELATVPHTPIGEVTAQLGMSALRFIQIFHAQVGLTHKLYCRVRRFQEGAPAHPQTGPGPVDWAEVALASGYFDQAHLIRDFKDFSGLTPAALLALPREHRNHVPPAGVQPGQRARGAGRPRRLRRQPAAPTRLRRN